MWHIPLDLIPPIHWIRSIIEYVSTAVAAPASPIVDDAGRDVNAGAVAVGEVVMLAYAVGSAVHSRAAPATKGRMDKNQEQQLEHD